MKKNKIPLLLSFFMPAAVFTVVFALFGVSPFGSRNIFVSDMGLQYYPFMADYLQRVKEGRSIFWSWTLGGGADYLTVFTYYLSSPLNLLLLSVPESVLPEAVVFLTVLKIGLAGLFMGIFLTDCFAVKLRRTSAPGLACDDGADNGGILKGFAVPIFATFYALSSFSIIHYWVINLLDAFAMLPLVILGETVLFREGKFKLYIIALSLSIITNFYMGYYTCVFVAIIFFAQCYIQKLTLKEFKQKLALIAVCSVIAMGITALLTLPAYIYITAMGPTSLFGFPDSITFTHSFRDIIANVLAFFRTVTESHNMPNLYCGMLCVILIGPYLGSPSVKIKPRERAAFVVFVTFMLISFNVKTLDYMWNAFRFVNGLDFRYVYLLFFTVTAAGYQSFVNIIGEGVKKRDLLLFIVVSAFILSAAATTVQAPNIPLNAALIAGYILIFIVLGVARNLKNDKARAALDYICVIAIAAAVLTETGASMYKSVRGSIRVERGGYYNNYTETKALLGAILTSSSNFYRVELTAQYEEEYFRQYNDPALFGYRGLSFYSSTVAEGMAELYKDLGLPVVTASTYNYSAYGYSLSSPVANIFLNLRYIIGALPQDDSFWDVIAETREGELLLLENNKYLPLGFMVNETILEYAPDTLNPFTSNPFIAQNNLFSLATGLDNSLFTLIPPANVTSAGYTVYKHDTVDGYIFALETDVDSGSITFEYEIPEDNTLYVYLTNSAHATISTPSYEYKLVNRFPYIIPAGYFMEGETIRLNATMTAYDDSVEKPLKQGGTLVYATVMDKELFNTGYDILADEVLRLTEFRDTYIRGEITALADGLLYTSIPLSDNWTAYVDGAKTEIVAVGGAVAGLKVNAGEHIIEFRYFNKPFVVGVVISLLSLGAFVVMWRGLPCYLGRANAPCAPRDNGQ